jgi:CHASE2 domain-containing sensor protein
MDLLDGGIRTSLIVAAIAVAAMLGFFRPVDDLLGDAFTRLAGARADAGPRRVLLVEAPIDEFIGADTDWEQAAQQLLALGALRVAFTTLPTLDPERLRRLIDHPSIDVAAGVDREALDTRRVVLQVTPELQTLDIPAVVVAGDAASAVRRHMPYGVQVDDRRLPTIEAHVVRQLGQDIPAQGRYRVGFLDGLPRDFPRTALAPVIRGELVEEAVAGRVALIGPVSKRFESTVVTPMTTGRQPLSALEFHGYALDSLLRGRTVGTLPPWGEAVLVVLAGILAHFVIRPMSLQRGTAFIFLGIGVLLATSALLLPWLLLHLPVTAPALALTGVTLSGFLVRSRRQGQALGELVTTSALTMVGRWSPSEPRDERELWTGLLDRVAHYLPIERAVLFRWPVDGTRLVAVAASGTDLAQSAPREPDPNAPPFDGAIAAAPHAVDVTDLLEGGAAGEQQLLIALASGGQPVGFLACGVDRERLEQWPGLRRALSQVAHELGELMLARRGERRGQGGLAPASRWGASRRDAVLQRLVYNLQGLDRRFALAGNLFEGLHTPVLACDGFGRTIAANGRMQALLSRHVRDATKATAGEVIDALSGIGPRAARDVVAGALFDGREFERAIEDADGGRSRLRVVPLDGQRQTVAGAAGPNGLIIEVASAADATGQAGADLRVTVERAIARVVPAARRDRVEFDVQGDRQPVHVALDPQALVDLLAALLQLLEEDARHPGVVSVRIDLDGNRAVIELRNDGFGMPPEALHAALDGPELPAEGLHRRIRMLRDRLLPAGSLVLESKVGRGYVARVDLPAAG